MRYDQFENILSSKCIKTVIEIIIGLQVEVEGPDCIGLETIQRQISFAFIANAARSSNAFSTNI
jgi:hypothetical protein